MTGYRALQTADELRRQWNESPRWRGVQRGYQAEDVVRLRGTIPVEHSIARLTAEKLWRYINEKPFVNALGALTGNQAMQQVKAGLDAIYLSGWQVAGDANLAGEMYPDQSLYPANSVPLVVKRINNTFQRADQIQWSEGKDDIDWLQPIIADAAELAANPRSRSAKLRVGERTEAPARDLDQDILALAALPVAQRERKAR